MNDQLRKEYESLFASCKILPLHMSDVAFFAHELFTGKHFYDDVQNATLVPWFVVGLIHGMECDFNFKQHLHNGDPLTARTVNVPAGRPHAGNPPFTFLESAIDALQYDNFIGWNDWSIAGICYKLEAYNGWGYRKHGINSPYLWSYSNHYTSGKYVADGQWSASAVSKQCGAITALSLLISQGDVVLIPQAV